MENWLAASPWPGMVLWVIIYISDYYLTIYAAKGFREIGHFKFEGSYELTPQYQNDINALKPISRLHITLLAVYSLVILFLWWFSDKLLYLQGLYLFYLGMFLLLEVAVHVRHFRNIFLIHEVRRNDGVEGQIAYKKTLSYKISAFDFYSFFVLYLIVFILTFSFFFLGGAIMCLANGIKHNQLSKKAAAILEKAHAE